MELSKRALMSKLFKSLLALPMGLTAGFLAGFLHQASFKVLVTIYWGIVFVLICLIIVMRWNIKFANTKLAAVFFIPGWFVSTYFLSTFTNAGDIVIANDMISKVYLATGVILMGITAVWPIKN